MEWVIALIAVAVVALFVKTVVVVPHMEAWVIERLGPVP
jgi:regulator of protease activity HflC (stomatin/prohibitin superfamily)